MLINIFINYSIMFLPRFFEPRIRICFTFFKRLGKEGKESLSNCLRLFYLGCNLRSCVAIILGHIRINAVFHWARDWLKSW